MSPTTSGRPSPVRHHGVDVFRGGRQRGRARLRIACVSVLHGHADHGAGFEIDRVLGFVGQTRAPVLPLRYCRVGIVRMPPVVVRPFLRPLAINARQIGTGRRLDTGRLRELRQEGRGRLAGVTPHDAAPRRVGLQRRRVDPDRRPIDEARLREAL